MSKIVGLSRAIKPEWLDKTVELVTVDNDLTIVKEKLNEYLSFEIGSPTVLRKTREILLNVWVRSAESTPIIWNMAIKTYNSERGFRLALNWAMLLLAYPVFADVTGLIGKISRLQDTFTVAWLHDKLHEIWGERSTLKHSSTKILQTLKFLGVIENVKPGIYQTRRYSVTDEQSVGVLLLCLLAIKRQAYYEISELTRVPFYFPFDFTVSMEYIHFSTNFTLEKFGGRTVLSANDSRML